MTLRASYSWWSSGCTFPRWSHVLQEQNTFQCHYMWDSFTTFLYRGSKQTHLHFLGLSDARWCSCLISVGLIKSVTLISKDKVNKWINYKFHLLKASVKWKRGIIALSRLSCLSSYWACQKIVSGEIITTDRYMLNIMWSIGQTLVDLLVLSIHSGKLFYYCNK